MNNLLKIVPCFFVAFFVSCSIFVAGTTEETNALAQEESSSSMAPYSSSKPRSSSSTDPNTSMSSSSYIPVSSFSMVDTTDTPKSSGMVTPISSSSFAQISSSSFVRSSSSVETGPSPMLSRYWAPYWSNAEDEFDMSMHVDVDAEEGISVSYEVSMPLSGTPAEVPTGFGIEIRVDGEGPDVFSEMKTWTGGVCFMLTSDVPIVLKMGMSPEKEKELEYDVPQATLIGPNDVGNLVMRCLSWTDFEQQGTGPSITIEEAFFDYMTALRFELQPDSDDYKGTFEIYQMRAGGSGMSANIDGTEVHLNDGE